MKYLKGFSLFELIVTIAIFGILTTLAFPSFVSMHKRYEIEKTMSLSRSMLHEARNTALAQHLFVVVCPTKDLQTCQKTHATHMMSFVDINKNKYRDDEEIILTSHSIDLHYGDIRFNVSAGRAYIRYFPDTGKPRGHWGNITYCPDDKDMKYAKSIIMNRHGRARYSHDKNNDGIDENSKGKNLSC